MRTVGELGEAPGVKTANYRGRAAGGARRAEGSAGGYIRDAASTGQRCVVGRGASQMFVVTRRYCGSKQQLAALD